MHEYFSLLWFNRRIGGAAILSDIMFLSKKEYDGKLRTASGSIAASGDIASLTANTGKDMYIARAQVTYFSLNNVSLSYNNDVTLYINGTIIGTAKFSYVSGSGSGMLCFSYDFKNIGHKVTAGQIIKIANTYMNTATQIDGFIECFEEDIGVDPSI